MAEKVDSADKIDVGEWKTISTSKSFPGIPSLGSNAYSCPCSNCKAILKETAHWTSIEKGEFSSIFKIGDRVLVYGALPGVVRYVGDLDSDYTNGQVLVGVKLDDPVGEHDGIFQNKRFFKCPDKHGVIVPLEAVHLLLPSDGHKVKASNTSGVANKFSSMPQLMETVKSEMPDTSTKAPNSPITEHHSPISMQLVESISSTTDKTKTRSSGNSGCVSKPSGSILKVATKASNPSTSGVTDANTTTPSTGNTASKVFIKMEPESVISMQSSGLKSLSCSAAAVAKPKFGRSSVNIMESKSVPDSAKPNMTSVSAKSPKSGKSVKNRGSAGSLKSSSGGSMKSLSGNKSSQRTKSSTSVKSASAKSLGKFAASTARSAARALSKENSKNVGESPATQSETNTPEGDSKAPQQSQISSPKLPLPKSSPEGKFFKISPKPSFTKCLLSGLPVEWMITPATADDQLRDVQDFTEWVEAWGGGLKGWAMAQTLQKLKTAHHKGKKEVLWQKTIDELEEEERYGSRIQRIKALRQQIDKVRSRHCDLDEQIRSTVSSSNETKLTVTQIEEDIKVQKKAQEELMEKLVGHPLAGKVKGLKKFLGLED